MLSEIFTKITKGEDTDFASWTIGSGEPYYFIVAGLHGNEPTSIQVAIELIEVLEEDHEITGTISIVPLANRLAFLSKSRTSLDNKDLNRNFPGSSQGSITERLANRIWQSAKKADYVLDLHCCGLDSSPYILATYKEHEHSKEFSSSFGLDICIQSSGIDKPQLFVEASKQGIPAVIIEIPGGGSRGWKPRTYVQQIKDAVLVSLHRLGFINYNTDTDITPRFAGELTKITTPRAGIFDPIAKPGDDLTATELIGEINGDTEIMMAKDGRLVFSSPQKFVLQGDIIGRYVKYVSD